MPTGTSKTTPAPAEHESLEAALAAFQADMPVVPKTSTARIPGRDGKQGYSYQYADLADVTEAAMPLLARHGLSFTCLPTRMENGTYELVGKLLHASGSEPLVAALPLSGRQAQEIGSSITYMRRYLLGCMTGIVTDEDEDGTIAAANAERTRQEPGPVEQMIARVRTGWNNLDSLRALRAPIHDQGIEDVEVQGPDQTMVPIGTLVADRILFLEHQAEQAQADAAARLRAAHEEATPHEQDGGRPLADEVQG